MSAFDDFVCSACSKPFRSGRLVLFQDGELMHIACRTRTLQLEAIEEVDRARVAQERSAQLLDEVTRRQRTHLTTGHGACPLCGRGATVTDWRPNTAWIAVEGCSCLGFFADVRVYQERLPNLTATEKPDLAIRVRQVRVFGHEAWVTTANGDPRAPLVVRTERPDRPT